MYILYFHYGQSELFKVWPKLTTSLLLCSMYRGHIISYPQNKLFVSSEMSNEKLHKSRLPLNYHYAFRSTVWPLLAEKDFSWVVTLLIANVNGTHCITGKAGKESSRMATEDLLPVRTLPQLCVLLPLCWTLIQMQSSIPISFWTFSMFVYHKSELAFTQPKKKKRKKGIEFAWINMFNMPWHQPLAARREELKWYIFHPTLILYCNEWPVKYPPMLTHQEHQGCSGCCCNSEHC